MIEGSRQSDPHERKESDIEEAKKLIQKYFRVLMLLMLFPKYLWGSNVISEIEAISEILRESNASNVFRGSNTSNAFRIGKRDMTKRWNEIENVLANGMAQFFEKL